MAEFKIVRDGYGQVEPNHLTAMRNGHVYAQLPAAASIDALEQGVFVKYDYANGEINFTGQGPWRMVYNEEKLYDERKQLHKHYAMKRSDFYENEFLGENAKFMVPRVFAIEAGDTWTTNMVKENVDYEPLLKKWLKIGANGVLEPDTAANVASNPAAPIDGIQIVALTTMPDLQNGLKVIATKNL